MTKQTESRLTVQAPRVIDFVEPTINTKDAKEGRGGEALLVRRKLETQVVSGAGTEFGYRGIDEFVYNAFKEAVERRESGSGGGRGGGG